MYETVGAGDSQTLDIDRSSINFGANVTTLERSNDQIMLREIAK
jgi:hypothetical protein